LLAHKEIGKRSGKNKVFQVKWILNSIALPHILLSLKVKDAVEHRWVLSLLEYAVFTSFHAVCLQNPVLERQRASSCKTLSFVKVDCGFLSLPTQGSRSNLKKVILYTCKEREKFKILVSM
jgi:hypothetical protein